ncbi:hypothetical protein glysoja_018905 [Glycine soja]|nr:hypothetical protein glysoja_018905 [Glycine soja]
MSAESMMQLATKSADQISQGSMMQLATKSASQISQGLVGSQPTKIDLDFDYKAFKGAAVDSAFDTQTEKAGLMQPENKLLQTTFPSSEVQDKITAGVSWPPGDADDGMSPTSRGENDGKK